MNDLRKHLDELTAEYRKNRYPGDLAEEILRQQRGMGRWLWSFAGAAAAAAAIALVLFMRPENPAETVAIVVEQPAPTTQVSLGDVPTFAIPQLSTEIDLAPTAPSFSISVPSFSMSPDEQSQTQSTTQESV
ncbi:MAG TPA: hypothetical protein VHD56_19045 [Tepidisphaeraceae bacterium]|nr:hypothetical protein [Tepidisphaeraceae bacterium]